MSAAFPRHVENVEAGRCARCRVRALLQWHFGPRQERKLCGPCGETEWALMLARAGRLAEWRRLVRA